jgi:hypothetical protein
VRFALLLAALAILASCKNRSNRISDTLACTPGETLVIGCTSNVGSPCTGDPAIWACDGTISPADCGATAGALAGNNDFEGLCPQVTVACPMDGRITVTVRGYTPPGGTPADFGCYWDISHGAPIDAGGGG